MLILLKTLQFIFSLIFLLPPAIAIRLMHFASEITYQIARLTKIKKVVSRNLSHFFPGADTKSLADKLLKNTSYSAFEVLCLPFFKEVHLKTLCKINGQENLDLALSRRKGVLILLMHTGNYEIVPSLLSSLGYRVNSILKAPRDPIFKLLSRSRGHMGVKIINVLEEDMYRESLKALGDNEIVGLLIDTGALEGKHEFFSFLGKQVPVATGWLTLAQRSEAAVVLAFPKREGEKNIVSFNEPFTVYRDNRQEVMQKVRQFFENQIRSHPEQWAMFLNGYEVKRMLGRK